MDAITDTVADAAMRILADLRANTTRTADQRADPAWHAMALVAFDLFGASAGEAVVLASRLAARSQETIAADQAEICAEIETLCGVAPSPPV